MSVRPRPSAPIYQNQKMPNEQTQLTAEDLEIIFSGKKPRRKNKAISGIKYSFLFLLIAFVIFSLINYQSLKKQLSYWYRHDYKNSQQSNINHNTDNFVRNNDDAVSVDIPNVSENHILIPDIDVDAPITWMVQNSETDTSQALQNGAIHLMGTSLPGTVGNVFVTAHSSNYAWAPGNYKSLFALLNKLTVGQLIYIKYHNNIYVYKVYEKNVIKSSDTSVLDQGSQSMLTLMTCTPVGTSLNRLIVKSLQVYPDATKNISNEQNSNLGSLPSIH